MTNLSDHPVVGELETILKCWDSSRPLFAIFISSTNVDTEEKDFIVDEVDGGLTNLLNCGQSSATMGTTAPQADPYSTRLRPVTPLTIFSPYKVIYLVKAQFRILDSTLINALAQNPDVNTAIGASLTELNDAYAQSRFRCGELGGFLPNFFRPSVKSKTGEVFTGLSTSSFGDKANKGDLSIGPILPYDFNPAFPVNMGEFGKEADCLQVSAGAGQIIQVGGDKLIQRYPVYCYLEFTGIKP